MKTQTMILSNPESPCSRNGRHHDAYSPDSMRWCLPRILIALGAALCAGPTTAQSQTVGPAWTTVDDVTNPAAVATGVAADGVGNLFVAGSIKDDAGVTRGLIQQSSDQGNNWITPDNIDIPGGRYERIVAKGGVTVAAACQGGACRVLGRSPQSLGTWSDLMGQPFRHPDPDYSLETIWDVELDSHNNIYVAAEYKEKIVTSIDKRGNVIYSSVSRPVILKRVNGIWLTPLEPAFLIKKILAVAVASETDPIFCSGDRWNVRKSSDRGVTWDVVDEFIDPQFVAWEATEIAMDRIGQLFVTGRAVGVVVTTVRNKKVSTQYTYWIVRKGVFGNGKWTWVYTDNFRIGTPSAENVAIAVTIDNSNNVLVTGKAGVDMSTSRTGWLTRKYSPTANAWITTDRFNGDGYDTRGNRMAADPFSGNVFATGGSLPSSFPRWIVRRQLAPQP